MVSVQHESGSSSLDGLQLVNALLDVWVPPCYYHGVGVGGSSVIVVEQKMEKNSCICVAPHCIVNFCTKIVLFSFPFASVSLLNT